MSTARHRSRRRVFVAAGVVAALAAGVGVAVAVTRSGHGGSSAQCPSISVVASPDVAPSLIALSQHLPRGFCGAVQVYAKDSDEVVTALAAGWRDDRDGPRPDVWVPDSSAWVQEASARAGARSLVPQALPSVVSSPLAIAVPEPVARAYGWPSKTLSWKDVLSLAQLPNGFGSMGHPEWGTPRIGLTDPETSTTGLLALTTIAATEAGRNVDAPLPRAAVDSVPAKIELLQLGRIASRTAASTADLFTGFRQAALQGSTSAIRYFGGTPASEQEIFAYNQGGPAVPLVAQYLSDGAPALDYPYATLDAPWVGDGERRVAAAFASFVHAPVAQQTFEQNGFRRSDGTAPAGFRADSGPAHARVPATLSGTPAGTYAEVSRLWTVLRQPTKSTDAWDISQSMSNYVPSAHMSKIDLMRQVGSNALSLFTDNDVAEGWVFTTALPDGATHKVFFPMGPMGGTTDGVPRRQYFQQQMNAQVPDGHTPLYQVTLDAYKRARQTYMPGYQNIVIVLTDGRNDDPADPLTLQQTVAQLTRLVDPARPIRLVAVGLGSDVDGAALKALAQATAGRAYLQPDPAKIGLTFLDAITSF